MPVLVRIAFRNILEHKSKSLIIGAIIALGVVIIVVGNSLMDSAAAGVEKSFIANYTGDVMITGVAKTGTISLFGVQATSGQEATPVIPEFEQVRERFASDSRVARSSPLVTGIGTIAIESDQIDLGDGEDEEDVQTSKFSFLLGIEGESYHELFDNLNIVSGAYLKEGETGIMITKKRAENLTKAFKKDITVGTKLLLSGYGVNGMKIREVPIVALFDFKQSSAATDMMSYADVQTTRELNGMTVGTGDEIVLDPSMTALLAADDSDSLFADDMIDASVSSGAGLTESGLDSLLAEAKPAARDDKPKIDTGAWNYLLLRLKGGANVNGFIATANAWFMQQGIAARAADWKAAAGPFGSTVDVVRVVFNIAIIILAVVAIIIMMNTLVISVMERTPEIGTMRALGAQKGFVWRMFLTETLTLTVVFGIIGMVLAGVVVFILNIIGIQAGNDFVELLFGGKVLRPAIGAGSLFTTLIMVIAVGFLAHLYPVAIAMKIPPIRAIQSE